MAATKCKKCGAKLNRIGECSSIVGPCNAEGRAPHCKSDGNRFPGHLQSGAQFKNPVVRARYLARAKAAGVNTEGKVYSSALAAFPGDPRAWTDSQADQVKLLEERNWSADGDLKVKARDVAAPPPVRLAEDLVQERLERELELRYPDAQNGKVVKIKKKEIERLRQEIIEKHGAPAPGALNPVKYVRGKGGGKGKKVKKN